MDLRFRHQALRIARSLFAVPALLSALTAPAVSGEVLAEVGGRAITADEVDAALAPQLGVLYQQIDQLKRTKLQELIAQELLAQEAARRGISISALLDQEVAGKTARVTDEEVDAQYREKKDVLRGSERVVRDRIRKTMQVQRQAARREALLRELRDERRVIVHLHGAAPTDAAPAARMTVPTREGAAVRGAPGGRIVIVEFSDFQCPFCRSAVDHVNRVLAAYPQDVQLVYRHFPLDALHPMARLAAQASECAGAAGRFWAYHDRLFAETTFSAQRLTDIARDVGIDVGGFERCLDGDWARGRVVEDVEAGRRVGVSGTPTFFVNGRRLVGAQSYDAFKRVIDQELTVLQ